MYKLSARLALPISTADAWNFLSDPKNLKEITPTKMGFQILSGGSEIMYPGQIIHYKVNPLPGYSTSWVTEITHVVEGSYFVDEQRFGPYTLWHHKHFIKATEGGVVMEDIIDYKLPFGILGKLFHSLLVKKQLLNIFNYRKAQLESRFGTLNNPTPSLQIEKI